MITSWSSPIYGQVEVDTKMYEWKINGKKRKTIWE